MTTLFTLPPALQPGVARSMPEIRPFGVSTPPPTRRASCAASTSSSGCPVRGGPSTHEEPPRTTRDRRLRLEPISYIGTCATAARWDAGRGGEPEAICRYCEGSRRRDAPTSPRPFGLRPGRSSASLTGLTISTYGLRRPPRIRSVLATTHHAPIYEIGSDVGPTGRLWRVFLVLL